MRSLPLLLLALAVASPRGADAQDSAISATDTSIVVHDHDHDAAEETAPRMVGDLCGPSIPADEALGFVPLPEGDLFCPLIADPKGTYSFISYVRGTSHSALGTDMGSVGIADRFPLVRWGGPRPGEGVQIGLDGAVFAQFDLNSASIDLINADYIAGIPLTLRLGNFSARLRVYHQSSHLGDEYILRSSLVQRENLSFEAGEALVSADVGHARVYGGGEYVFNARPREGVVTRIVHGGIELRQRHGGLHVGRLASVRMIAALDVKSVEVLDWEPAYSVRAGFEVGRAQPGRHVARRWSLLGEFYSGRSPYGQFYHDDVRYYGVGLHFEQ